MNFREKCFSCYILLTDQTLLSDCLYLLRPIVYFPSCDVKNSGIKLIFLIKSFFYMTENLRQKFKCLENEKRFENEIKSILLYDEEIIEKLYIICKIVQGNTATSPKETLKLPEFRVSCNHPFENVGTDYAGPLYLKENVNNCIRMSKYYMLLFTCAATRAAYLEHTPDVGGDSLILAVQKYISRNGIPKLLISDNPTSFKSKDIKNYL